MSMTLTMPKLSPTMEQGTIVKWLKKVGDQIQSGDVILEVATDKATVEHHALDEGWLRQILVEEGQEAIVNQPIAVLTAQPDEVFEKLIKEVASPSSKEEETEKSLQDETHSSFAPTEEKEKKKEVRRAQLQFAPEPPLLDQDFQYPTHKGTGEILASPLAKKIAKDKGLDFSTVKGTGPRQRIMSRDLERAQSIGRSAQFGSRQVPVYPGGTYEEVPLTQMRKIIGQRLQDSKSFIPHFYVTQVIDAGPLVFIREQLKNENIKLSVNDFIIRACALALREHPDINSGFYSANQTKIQFKTVDIAVAVNVEAGLLTPIIRHADYKNLGELSIEMRSLAARARDGKLLPEEYKGGSFTITNLGMYGVTDFQAILNPPQAAILAVSAIQDVPIVRKGVVVPGKTVHLSLSVDHRVIDGAAAAQFLQTLKKKLENPAILLVC